MGWRPFCQRCGYRLWQFFVIVLILLALLVSGLRLLSPYAQQVKQPVQQWFVENYQLDLDYQALQIEWQRFGLYLTLSDVTLNPVNGQQDATSLSSLSVRLEPWASALSQRIRFGDIRLRGLVLDLSLSSHSSSQTQTPWQRLLKELVSNRFQEFELLDARVYLGIPEQPRRSLMISSLRWRNDDRRHRGEGEAHVEGLNEQSVQFIVDIQGEIKEPEQVIGKLYLNVAHVSPHLFLTSWVSEQNNIEQSELNFQAWLDFDWQTLHKATLLLGENKLQWTRDGDALEREFLVSQGRVSLTHQPSGWQLASHDIRVSTNGVAWPELDFRIEQQGEQLVGNGPSLSLAQLTPLLELTSGKSEALLPWFLQLSGQVEALRWLYNPARSPSWLVTGRIEALSWPEAELRPSLENGTVEFEFSSEGAFAQIQVPEQPIQTGGHFSEPIDLKELSAEISFRQQDESWQLDIPQLQLQTAELAANVSARISPDSQGRKQLFLYGELDLADAAKAHYYFPLRAMSPDLVHYLTSALQGGTVSQARLLWHGAFADFPFQQQAGHFEVDVPLRDSRFKFQQDWPALEPLDLDLWFENSDLVMTASRAFLLGAEVKQLVATIPGLNQHSLLTISGEIQADGQSVRAVMNDSMLAHSVGQTLDLLHIEGPVAGPLHLAIPLGGGSVSVQGFAELANAQLNIPGTEHHVLREVNGKIYYQQESIRIEDLTGFYHEMPFHLNLTGDARSTVYEVNAKVSGHWPAEGVQQLPGFELLPLEGMLNWQGSVQAAIDSHGVSTKIKLTSDLQQFALKLPAPLHKTIGKKWPARVDIALSPEQQMTGRAVIGDQLFAMWQQSMQQQQASDYIWMGVGTQQPLRGTPPGMTLDMRQRSLNLTPWLKQMAANDTENTGLFFDQGLWQLDELLFQGYRLPDVDMSLTNQASGWQAQLNGPQISAVLTYQQQPIPEIRLVANQLQLLSQDKVEKAKWEEEPISESERLAAIPNLDILCKQCQLGEFFFDELGLKSHTDRQGEHWFAEQAWVKTGGGEIQLNQFDWTVNSSVARTEISGQVQARDIDEMVHRLYPAAEFPMKDSEVNGTFQLSWQGSPFEFALDKLKGPVEWHLSEGHIAEMSDKGARIFSLLSIDSLVRKIRLDFSDVFDKGLFYNEMSGKFDFREGIVVSENVVMDGVAGDMTLSGQTNLKTLALDYDAVFSPDLTSSLPLLAGLTINPVTGIYVLALQTVMKPVVEIVTQIRFNISGTTEQPIVTEVERRKREVKIQQVTEADVDVATGNGTVTLPLADDEVEPDGIPAIAPAQPPQPVKKKPVASAAKEEIILPTLPATAPLTVGDKE